LDCICVSQSRSRWAKSVKNAKSPSQALMKVFSNAVKAADAVIGEK